MKTTAIIQARMGSQRLPQKSLMTLNHKSLLANVIDSVRQHQFIDEAIVATTILTEDDAIENECKALEVKCERGDAENVLSRFLSIAKQLKPNDQIVRVTADNPLNNAWVSKQLFDKHLALEADYTCIDGLAHTVYEFVKVKALLKLERYKNLDEADKEHVTKYIREHADKFKVQKIAAEIFGIQPDLDKLLTLDTKEDFERLKALYQELDLHKTADFRSIYSYLNQTINV